MNNGESFFFFSANVSLEWAYASERINDANSKENLFLSTTCVTK